MRAHVDQFCRVCAECLTNKTRILRQHGLWRHRAYHRPWEYYSIDIKKVGSDDSVCSTVSAAAIQLARGPVPSGTRPATEAERLRQTHSPRRMPSHPSPPRSRQLVGITCAESGRPISTWRVATT